MAVFAGGALLAGAGALAQTVTYPPTGPKAPKWSDMSDWDSVWERGGDVDWDDRLPVGAPVTAPYNAEYAALDAKTPRRVRPGAPGAPPGGPPPGGAPAAMPGQLRFGGMPGMMTMLRPMEVQVNPHEVLLVGETGGIRRIYTDGRVHPAYVIPSAAGHSIGHWENKALIVDTCCVDTGFALPNGGPHSDAMHITERFYSPKPNMLVDEISVEDPKAFTKPWTTVKTFYRRPDWELLPAQLPGGGGGGPPAGGGAPGAGAAAGRGPGG